MKFDILFLGELVGLDLESDIEWMTQDLISDEIRKSADIKEPYEVGRLRQAWWEGAVTYPKGSIVIYDQMEMVLFERPA